MDKNLKYVVYILIAIFLAITNPSNSKHKSKIKEKVSSDYKTGLKILDDAILDVAGYALDYEYHDFVLFSTTTVGAEGDRRLISIGIAGFVISGSYE